MRISKRYQNFLNGRFFSEGLRITAGVVVPSFVLSYFGMLPTGLVISIGALCVSLTDQPGPVRHRLNGMMAGFLLCGPISILVHYSNYSVILLGTFITLAGFAFSMLTVYGNRLAAIGVASLVIMVLSMERPLHGWDIWLNGAYLAAGGAWYMIYSLFLYRLRPYRFLQQVLGDLVIGVSGYLRIRGEFYRSSPDFDKTFSKLAAAQVDIEHQQQMLSEMIFKTRAVLKESTVTSRVLLNTYLNTSDLFESIMTTYQDYNVLHEQFDHTGILEEVESAINGFSDELMDIGIALKSGTRSAPYNWLRHRLHNIRIHFEMLRHTEMKNERVDSFISLGRIIHNLEDLAQKINIIHYYTSYDKKIKQVDKNALKYYHPEATPDITPSILVDNLNFKSNVFRHSLRVSLALLAGFIVSLFLKVGHGYWILLTIIVILKPAYSLSKQRNKDRLIGTVAGLVAGIVMLFFIKNENVLLGLMICFMIVTYTFMRTNYFLSVLFMTPFLLIFYNFLLPGNITDVIFDRLIDTSIGSVIAFFASLFIVPVWEHTNIRFLMGEMLRSNDKYFSVIGKYFTLHDPVDMHAIRKARTESLVALANLSDAFNRMMSEPKRYQKGIQSVHRFVVLNHSLMSHLAALAYFLRSETNKFRTKDLLPVIANIRIGFNNAVECIERTGNPVIRPNKGPLKVVNEYASQLLDKRTREIERGELETETKQILVDVKSVTDQFNYIYNLSNAIEKNCMSAEL